MEKDNHHSFLRGGGEMGALISRFDWENSELGPIENWPLSLRNTLAMIMASKFPMFLWWGENNIQFYNDAYTPIMGGNGKHPLALGQQGALCWPEIWGTIHPIIDDVMYNGESIWFEDLLLPIYRNGRMEDVYWTFSYSSVTGDTGNIEGVLAVCADTTEKVMTIKHLKESKDELEFAIEAANLGTWDYDVKNDTFTANQTLCKWMGIPCKSPQPLEVLTSTIIDADIDKVAKAIQKALNYNNGGNYDIEYTIKNPLTNTFKTVRAQGRAWFDKTNAAYRFNGTVQDISSRKKAQKYIDEANHFASLAVKNAGIGLFQINLQDDTIYYDPNFAYIVTGDRDKKEITRQVFINHIHKDDLPARDIALKEGSANNDFHYTTRVIWDDGTVHHIVVMGSNTYDSGNDTTYFSGTVRDITQQENQRLALQESEEKFRAMIQEAPIATCLFAGKDMVIEIPNDIMLKYWGKDASVIGKPIAEAIPELMGQPFLEILDNVYATGISYEAKASFAQLIVNGTLRDYYFDFTYKPLFDHNGNVYAIMDMAMDVTEQVIAQKRIEESQKQILDSFEQSPVAIAILSRQELTITMANPFYCELVGRQRSEIIGVPLMNAIPELKGQGFDVIINDVITTGTPYIENEVEVLLNRENGPETVYVNLTFQPRKEADSISGILVVATDVTQQVTSRKKVEDSEQRLKSIIASAPAGMGLFIGRDLIIEMPNQTFIDIVGKGWDVVGKPLREAMPELTTEGQPFLKILDDVYTTGVMYHTHGSQVKIVRNGVMTYNYYNITYTPLFDENNKVYAILDIAIDVTEVITANQKLENAQASLRGAMELAQLANWRYDIKNKNYYYSPRFVEWLGFDGDIKGIEESFKPVPLEYRNKVQEAIDEAIAPGSDGIYDYEHPITNHTTGQVRIIHAQAQVFYDVEGQPEFLTGTAQDVTKERKLQQQLEFQVKQRTEELQAANAELAEANISLLQNNKELEQFAYIASHDLQEPARKISIFANMLRESVGTIDERSQNYLNKINSSAERMVSLIRDVLGYSRLSKEHEVFVPVDLQKVTDDIVNEFELILEQTNAKIIYNNLPVISAIPLQMSQLFGNLISNALKYSRPGVAPVITIEATLLDNTTAAKHLGADAKGQYYKIVFKDNGIGFEQKYADKIFNIFQRLHSKSEYSGTGIGLALCKKIMQNHYGDIQATGEENQGATFTIIIPLIQENYST